MLMALQHIHSVGILHRAIKPENFLYRCSTSSECHGSGVCDSMLCTNACEVVKADFELSVRYPTSCDRDVSSEFLSSMVGELYTQPYRPPEIIFGINVSDKSDVWALGVTLLVMLGANIWDVYMSLFTYKGLKHLVESNKIHQCVSFSDLVKMLNSKSITFFVISKCLQINYRDRPTSL